MGSTRLSTAVWKSSMKSVWGEYTAWKEVYVWSQAPPHRFHQQIVIRYFIEYLNIKIQTILADLFHRVCCRWSTSDRRFSPHPHVGHVLEHGLAITIWGAAAPSDQVRAFMQKPCDAAQLVELNLIWFGYRICGTLKTTWYFFLVILSLKS